MNSIFRSLSINFRKKPLYSFITFSGFTLGIAGGILIYLWVFNELSYEKFHPGFNRIYRVLTLAKEGDEIVKSAGSYRPIAKTLKADHPQIEFATYLSFDSEDSPLKIKGGNEKIEARGATTNADFFRVFEGFTFVEGSAGKAFSDPGNIVITEEVAHKLFGNAKCLGKTLISDKYDEEVYAISGVVRVPALSHIEFGYLLPENNRHFAFLADNWGDKAFVHTYIKLAAGANIDKEFIKSVTNHIGRYSSLRDKLMFQPLTDIHLHTDYQTYLYDKHISSYKYVLIFSALAFLIILMAALNFSVLSAARSSERSIEIGMKKVCGAERRDIIIQFLGEAIVQTLCAGILAVLIISLILPWFNSFTGQALQLQMSFRLIINLLVLILVTGLLSGIYPSLHLSALKPLRILRGGNASGSRSVFTRALVVIQFGIALFFMISAMVFYKQLNFMQHKDLGIEKQDILVIPTGLWYESRDFKNELLKNPDILSVTATAHPPVDYSWQGRLAVSHGNRIDSIRATMIFVDEDFARTYKISMAKGEFLKMTYDEYWTELQKASDSIAKKQDFSISIPVVINESAEKQMHFANPIGQRIGDYVIVGVVKDFHFRPLRYPIGPLIMTNDPQNIMTMNVRISPVNRQQTIKFIADTYKKYRNDRAFSFRFFDDLIAEGYQEEIRLRNLTLLFSVFALVIAMLGIFGMAVFTCRRRTREIGIRKANGASSGEIISLLNGEFLRWVGVAFIVACPFAWFVMYRWLQNFAYQTAINWWIFAVAGIMSVSIALVAVNWQTWRAAGRNPARTLRNE